MKNLAALLFLGLSACCGSRNAVTQADMKAESTRPLMVYRTRQNVYDKVPVGLSDDKQHIISYPQPKDLLLDGKLRLPTKLAKGYWLDNKGIGLNTGFLNMTYAEYAALSAAPSLADLEAGLLDRDPLLSLCDCGTRGSMEDPVKSIGEMLKADNLRQGCKVLK
jgi:hypothetical protein